MNVEKRRQRARVMAHLPLVSDTAEGLQLGLGWNLELDQDSRDAPRNRVLYDLVAHVPGQFVDVADPVSSPLLLKKTSGNEILEVDRLSESPCRFVEFLSGNHGLPPFSCLAFFHLA